MVAKSNLEGAEFRNQDYPAICFTNMAWPGHWSSVTLTFDMFCKRLNAKDVPGPFATLDHSTGVDRLAIVDLHWYIMVIIADNCCLFFDIFARNGCSLEVLSNCGSSNSTCCILSYFSILINSVFVMAVTYAWHG